jgi:two-component system chemotaxis response regulator CheB
MTLPLTPAGASSGKKITILVVDDSAVARMHLVHILEADPEIRVMATVNDGEAALAFLKEHRPDVVLMDVNMPGPDGFEITRRIMETRPVPIVICSGTANPRDVAAAFRVIEAGAVACVEKPMGYERREFEQAASELRRTVKRISEAKILKNWTFARTAPDHPASSPPAHHRRPAHGISVVGIGASTGGPVALQKILGGLPKDFPAPILVVQHIGSGFVGGLAEWLNQTSSVQVCLGSHGTRPLPGYVYVAPDDFHMGLDALGSIELSRAEPENRVRPAVAYLFRTLARECGPAAIGVMLTGMGEDGAVELKQMRDEGASTIAQDSATSVVHGMPGVAIDLGGAMFVTPVGDIASKLIALVERAHREATGASS